LEPIRIYWTAPLQAARRAGTLPRHEENLRGRIEYLSPVGDDESASRSFHFTPEQSAECGQAVEQAAAANQ